MIDRPAMADRPPLMSIGVSREPARRRWIALTSWIRPDATAHAPKTAIAAAHTSATTARHRAM
jgi:hypothetical protein